MPRQPHNVTYGTGDFLPPDVLEVEEEATQTQLPSFLWLTSGNQIRSIDFGDAQAMVRGSHYYPWYWLGLLECGQAVPVASGYLTMDVRTAERLIDEEDDTSNDEAYELCAADRAEQFSAYAG